MNALPLLFDMVCSLIVKLDDSSKNRELAGYLSGRVSVLLRPLEVLLPEVIEEKVLAPCVDRLVRILQEVNVIGDKLLGRSKFGRFLHSKGDREKLRDIETRLDSCVNDLNLLISLNSNKRLQELQSTSSQQCFNTQSASKSMGSPQMPFTYSNDKTASPTFLPLQRQPYSLPVESARARIERQCSLPLAKSIVIKEIRGPSCEFSPSNKAQPYSYASEPSTAGEDIKGASRGDEGLSLYSIIQAFSHESKYIWEEVWIHLCQELFDQGLEPTNSLEQELKALCKVNSSGVVRRRNLKKALISLEDPDELQDLLDEASDNEKLLKYLDYGQPYRKPLRLKVLSVDENYPFSYEVGDSLIIGYYGMEDSPRYCEDRLVWFGNSLNKTQDVQFDPRDNSVCPLVFQIMGNSDGYYVIDFARANIAMTLVRDNSVMLEEGDIFVIGTGQAFAVIDACSSSNRRSSTKQQASLKLLGLEGEFSGRMLTYNIHTKLSVSIGTRTEGYPKEIEFAEATDVDEFHARIFYDEGRCYLEDFQTSNGTWLRLANYNDWLDNKVTEPRSVKKGDVIAAGLYQFVVRSA
eukprot:CAMPEP_0204919978 /NCGR_PEP_ID=MMETSP1397-20131031/17122_1 /ASSEMBLY_ACC=CAM_ASM_000891 /TAXON_ID=49980 /ORGANISM="Climacostomum Climacostomum virens, Strain Stock W-24" /LENGTH=577 /DNA_ID=CAMNT_0052093625 /DNA_START=66 /DNA_END=1799 /DNA_ORIENTATION=+